MFPRSARQQVSLAEVSEAKVVLYKDLQQLPLAKIRRKLRTDDNTEAIRELRRQIECKSANGPQEYRSVLPD